MAFGKVQTVFLFSFGEIFDILVGNTTMLVTKPVCHLHRILVTFFCRQHHVIEAQLSQLFIKTLK